VEPRSEWYKGDGAYGDGPRFHWHYNNYVISPSRASTGPRHPRWALREAVEKRAALRWPSGAPVPDGSFAPGAVAPYRAAPSICSPRQPCHLPGVSLAPGRAARHGGHPPPGAPP
jgi:hypothetical protein